MEGEASGSTGKDADDEDEQEDEQEGEQEGEQEDGANESADRDGGDGEDDEGSDDEDDHTQKNFALSRRVMVARELYNSLPDETKESLLQDCQKEYEARKASYAKALAGEDLYDPTLVET